MPKQTSSSLMESVLDWHYRNFSEIERIYLSSSPNDEDITEPVDPSFHRGEQREFLAERRPEFSYLISGVSYKSALLRYILRNQCQRDELRLLDVGGGYGALAAELLLDPGLNIAQAIVCDADPTQFFVSKVLNREISKLASRLHFKLAWTEEIKFPKSDVICFIGSLLYVAAQGRQGVVECAWDSLERGGVLIVHENIKTQSLSNDNDLMFTVDEIDQLLGQFGSVRRYLSTATREVSAEQAGQKTVFRVVQKA